VLEIGVIMARYESLSVGKLLLVLATISIFFLSLYFSLTSLTGYVVNQTIDAPGNWFALISFLIGIVLTYFLVWKNK